MRLDRALLEPPEEDYGWSHGQENEQKNQRNNSARHDALSPLRKRNDQEYCTGNCLICAQSLNLLNLPCLALEPSRLLLRQRPTLAYVHWLERRRFEKRLSPYRRHPRFG
jgi:hypothetical protein